ncbi:type II toxin-antitoxin system RelE/ParE family toxin, partial [bacterium]|nr:type II toxin-antitoxin system RelE/ParE family toxin [bacterium]
MKLVLSPQAALDLEEIGDYIARDSPKRAVLFIEQIEAHCQSILTAPNAYPFRSDLAADVQIAVHQ